MDVVAHWFDAFRAAMGLVIVVVGNCVGLVQIEPGCTLGIQASLNESYFANLPC